MSLAAVVIAAKTDAIDVVMPTPVPIARTVLPHLDVQRVRSLRGECDGGADRFKHTGRVDPPACGPRGHLVLRARAQLHPRLVRQGVVERVEKFLTCRTRFAPWKLSLIPRMPGASGRTPTSLRCRRGPGERRGCPASRGFGVWRSHRDYCHFQRVSFPIVTDASRVFPLARWSPRAVRTSHQMDRSESPCTHVAGVKLLDPGGTVKGPTTHLAGVWFRSSSITTNELSGAMATKSMRPPRLVSTDESPVNGNRKLHTFGN